MACQSGWYNAMEAVGRLLSLPDCLPWCIALSRWLRPWAWFPQYFQRYFFHFPREDPFIASNNEIHSLTEKITEIFLWFSSSTSSPGSTYCDANAVLAKRPSCFLHPLLRATFAPSASLSPPLPSCISTSVFLLFYRSW